MYRRIAILVLLAAVTGATQAEDFRMTTGQWETKVVVDFGGPIGRRMVLSTCVTEENAADLTQFVPNPSLEEGDCVVKDWEVVENKATWKMWCRSTKTTSVSGEIVFGSDSYEGTVIIEAPDAATMKLSGQRLGDCEK